MKNQHILVIILVFSLVILGSFTAVIAENGTWDSTWNRLLESTMLGFGQFLPDRSEYIIPGWDPLEPWELQQCEQKLTSEIQPMTGKNAPSSLDPFIFGMTLTLQASQRSNDYEEDYFENEIAWYIESVTKNVSFTLSVIKESSGESVLQEQRIAPQGRGDAGYYSWVGDDHLTHARINFEGNYFEVPFVQIIG